MSAAPQGSRTGEASGMAIASLVLGIVSIPTCMCYGVPSFVCGALAILFGVLARKQTAGGTWSAGSRPMATAGTICGAVGLALSILYWIALVALVILSISLGAHGQPARWP